MKLAAMVAGAALAVAGSALATPPACKGTGSTSAKPDFYYTADQNVLDGLAVSLGLGLEPPSFPSQDITKHPDACVRASFAAGGGAWTLFGDDGDTPPRWATTSSGRVTVYLAAMPPPDQAHLWAEARRQHPTSEKTVTFKGMAFALVAADGDERRVFGFYDSLPDDARLTAAMQAAIDGRTPFISSFNVRSGKADLSRIFEPQTLQALRTKGQIAPVELAAPDGVAFEALPEGVARARVSHLVCPPALEELQRIALFTTGASDGGQEAGCRYVGEQARLTIVISAPAKHDSARNVADRILAAPKAEFTEHPQPGTTQPTEGIPVVIGAASFLKSSDGTYLQIWSGRRADWWFMELYVLYGPDASDLVAKAVTDISKANKAPS